MPYQFFLQGDQKLTIASFTDWESQVFPQQPHTEDIDYLRIWQPQAVA